MSELRHATDPVSGQRVEIRNDLTRRLRGQYANGPTMANGEPEFGWRQFGEGIPIQLEAAAEIERLRAEVARLESLVHVPGVWRCAKCDFRLIQSNLNANTGTVTARDEPGDKCPNCKSPLWRVTERQERTEAMELAETGFLRAGKAEDALQDLADAADAIGVRFFDTDTMEPEVEAMQKATLAAREVLEPKTRRARAPATA